MLMFAGLGSRGLGSSCKAYRTHVPLPNGQWLYFQQDGSCGVRTKVVADRTLSGADDGGGSNLGLYITSGLLIGVGILIAWAQSKS